LGHLKTFRGGRGHELINHDRQTAWVSGSIVKSGVQHQLEIALQKSGRTPKVDKKQVSKLSQFFGYLRIVLFSPEELANIKGFPAGRRALLDRAILQTDPAYLDRMQ
jgi:DNA replication and repair protein RecF